MPLTTFKACWATLPCEKVSNHWSLSLNRSASLQDMVPRSKMASIKAVSSSTLASVCPKVTNRLVTPVSRSGAFKGNPFMMSSTSVFPGYPYDSSISFNSKSHLALQNQTQVWLQVCMQGCLFAIKLFATLWPEPEKLGPLLDDQMRGKRKVISQHLCYLWVQVVFIRKAFNFGKHVVDEGRMKSTWRSWLFPNIIFLSSKCGASPPGWATWEITEFPTHQQYKIDVYINLYSSGKLLTLGWETNHIVVIAGVLEIPWFPGWPNQVVRHHT